jgi:hypothetical protein
VRLGWHAASAAALLAAGLLLPTATAGPARAASGGTGGAARTAGASGGAGGAEVEERPPAGMKARVFQLKHRDADDVMEAVRPLMSDTRGSMMRKSDELKTVSARDFPENLAAIDQALKRLDVPSPPQPDVEVQIRILIGSPSAATSQFPPDLDAVVKQLGSTLSYKSYHLIAQVTQRLRIGTGSSGKGELVIAPPASDDKTNGHFHYNFESLAMPPATGTTTPLITLRRFKLVLEGGGLGEAEVSTGLTLREGEKVVVGTGSLKNRAMIVVVSARQLRGN